MTASLKVQLVEPYYGGSHRAWADGLVANSRHNIRLVTHPDRFWRWRMRGSAVTLAEAVGADIAANGAPDVVVVSDMVDLAALLGFARRDLASSTPVALYMHENQLVYPLGPGQQFDEGLALRNWTSVAAADAVWFNSEFHRLAFFDALPELLRRPPEQRHLHLLDGVAERSMVLPVGVAVADLVARQRSTRDGAPLVVWTQRWDHDKNPEAVFTALAKLADDGVDFRLAVTGQNTRVDPREFDRVRHDLGDRIVHLGELERGEYLDLLIEADIHVTASHHEFFGVAPVEAVAAGCVPVWPGRQSYPELIPAQFHDDVLYSEGDLCSALRRTITELPILRERLAPLRTAMLRYDWATVAPQYDQAIHRLLARAFI